MFPIVAVTNYDKFNAAQIYYLKFLEVRSVK